MKEKILKYWLPVEIFLMIILSVVVLFLDRIFMIFFLKRELPSITEINEIPFYRKELFRRTRKRLIVAGVILAAWLLYCAIIQTIVWIKILF